MSDIPEAGLRLALYARVSTEEQREGQTIDSQLSELERFSREKGWPIVRSYKDNGWSGGVMERPELDRLRDDAQHGDFDAVLINDVDRLARDVAHLGVIKRDLERKGIRVIFRKLPSETSPTYNLMVNILGSFAEFERELIADRTRRGRRHKIEVRKQYLGSNTAYGYRYIPIDRLTGREGSLEVLPAEASVVKQMFEWVDQDGLSARRVLNRLNELKIPPRGGAPKWGKSSVLRILRCETYAGVWHYNKHQSSEPLNPEKSPHYRKRAKCSVRRRPKSEWLPLALPESLHIVPSDRWRRVQQQLDRNIAFSPRNQKRVYLLKGLVRCGGCGYTCVGDPCHGKSYYRCTQRCRKLPAIQQLVLDTVVKEAVSRVIVHPEVLLEPLRQLDKASEDETRQQLKVADKVKAQLNRLQGEEERVLDAYRMGVLTPAQLGQQLAKLKGRRVVLENEQSAAHQQPASPENAIPAIKDFCFEAAKNLANFDVEHWQQFLRTIIQSITYNGSDITIHGRIPLTTTGAAGKIQLDVSIARNSS